MQEFTPQNFFQRRLSEVIFILAVAISVFWLLALISYNHNDPSWSFLVNSSVVSNAAGRAGAWIADIFFYICGMAAFLFPITISYLSWDFYKKQHTPNSIFQVRLSLLILRVIGFLLVIMMSAGLCNLILPAHWLALPFTPGGVIGYEISRALLSVFNLVGSSLLFLTGMLVGITLLTGLSWLKLIESVGTVTIALCLSLIKRMRTPAPTKVRHIPAVEPPVKRVQTIQVPRENKPAKIIKPEISKPEVTKPESSSQETHMPPNFTSNSNYVFPDLALLTSPQPQNIEVSEQELESKSIEVEQRLNDFGVHARVVAVHPGPVITRYELELAAGTKASKISNLAKDLARSLSVVGVRVVEVIPGKSYVGLELPNKQREIVCLQEVLASKAFQNSRSALTLALGKDISGHPVIVDLAKMPHLLVAGTTGAGKSVSLNTMLLSLLYKSSPHQLRLILIDPKMLELSVYEGIPHLLTPVVTDMNDASTALRWCVAEMERRYRLMSALGVRNIAGYNLKISEAAQRGTPIMDPLILPTMNIPPKELQELPQIVVLADEFADMMAVVGKKVEMLISRLAQKARAAGIHLILATQRPSVDVITGLIKANIPTRIAFQVSSKIDSRTILDQQGAEQLLGYGDMLYLAPGTGVPVRVHGAYVDDDEVHRVVGFLKQFGKPDYVEEVINESASNDAASGYGESDDGEKDALYDEAVEAVIQSRRVSISSIQRRFKIGYNRAARIVEAMEEAGVVSRMESNGNREVLVPERGDE